jgi:DNA-binding Lrp family transcriptional regulator
MRHKKGKVTQSASVSICEVARSLPIDAWFSIDSFSEFTGIKRASCQQRINSLVDNGFLDREKGYLARNNRFKMSMKARRLMIEKGNKNTSKRIQYKLNKQTERLSIDIAITEAYTEQSERILKSAGFM